MFAQMLEQDTFTQMSQALATQLGINFYPGQPGRCFRNVMMFAFYNPQWTIVHGLARQYKGAPLMVHAWCELRVEDALTGKKNWVVHCPSQSPGSYSYRGILPRPEYYKSCFVAYTKRYSFVQAQRESARTNIFGPWDKTLLKFCVRV